MSRYPHVTMPESYIDRLVKHGFDHSEGWLEEALILCDYCIQDYLKDKSRALGVSAGWLTNEKCPLHRKNWMKLWFLS